MFAGHMLQYTLKILKEFLFYVRRCSCGCKIRHGSERCKSIARQQSCLMKVRAKQVSPRQLLLVLMLV